MGVLEQAALRQAQGQAFALATVVRTVSVTAAKAGAKALIGPDGSIEEGWIGGSSRSRPKTRLPNSGRRRARSVAASSSPRTHARAREQWTCSSSRFCRARAS
jgi:xanthine/CO dehydrogenase XdhC/CoxF family maturation factor